MQLPEDDKRRSYDQPLLRKLSPEQACLFLVGRAYVGHQGAKELLELLFPEPLLVSEVETGMTNNGRLG